MIDSKYKTIKPKMIRSNSYMMQLFLFMIIEKMRIFMSILIFYS
jgi:hypothetical protein